MGEHIKDGSGSGYLAKVDVNKRLFTNSVTTTTNEDATTIGNSYNINTGIITLTDGAETPIMYIKNNEVDDLIITAIAVGVGPTTGGSGSINKITVVRNPKTGTIISNAINVDIKSNRNYGFSKTILVDSYKGATGNTMTDGEDHLFFFQGSSSRLFATIDEVLPQGSSLGVKFQSQPSNTSQEVYVAIICHIRDLDL